MILLKLQALPSNAAVPINITLKFLLLSFVKKFRFFYLFVVVHFPQQEVRTLLPDEEKSS